MDRQSLVKKSRTRIAVPYYGQLVRPGVGVEKIYFVVDVGPHAGESPQVALRVWNPGEVPDLSVWLRKRGVHGVICSDTALKCHYDFDAEGIWVMGGERGEVGDIVKRWTAGKSRNSVLLTQFPRGGADLGASPLFQVARPEEVAVSLR